MQHRPTPLLHLPQVATLSGLQELVLGGGGDIDDYDPLTRMAALTALTIMHGIWYPGGLPALTQLLALALQATPDTLPWGEGPEEESLEGWEHEFDPDLAQLTRLTRLAVDSPPPAQAFPPSLSSLHQLRVFLWQGRCPADPRLPPGAWLAGLQQLTLPRDAAEGSLVALPQGTRLERLRVSLGDTVSPSLARLVAAAAALPSMRELALGCSCSASIAPSVQTLAAASPELQNSAAKLVVETEPPADD